MKFFLDSAIMDEIEYAYENWAIDGVTTNPKHIRKSGLPFHQVIREIASMFDGLRFPISVEIDPHLNERDNIVDSALRIADVSENFVIKLACTEQGLAAARKLKRQGIDTNITLVFSASQALQAGRIGARFVSPFVGWKESSGESTGEFVRDTVRIYRNYGFETEIIVAAIRNGSQIVQAAREGADIVTVGFDVYRESFHHPFTDHGIEVFGNAWDETNTSETAGA